MNFHKQCTWGKIIASFDKNFVLMSMAWGVFITDPSRDEMSCFAMPFFTTMGQSPWKSEQKKVFLVTAVKNICYTNL